MKTRNTTATNTNTNATATTQGTQAMNTTTQDQRTIKLSLPPQAYLAPVGVQPEPMHIPNWCLMFASVRSMGETLSLDVNNSMVRICYRELLGFGTKYDGLTLEVNKYKLGGDQYATVHVKNNVTNATIIAQYLDATE